MEVAISHASAFPGLSRRAPVIGPNAHDAGKLIKVTCNRLCQG